jgi:D-lactate dehydrogenase
LPEAKRTLHATFWDIRAAATAVSAIMAQPVTPCALELMNRDAIGAVRSYCDLDPPAGSGALLMIEVDGPVHCTDHAAESIARAARIAGPVELRSAKDAAEVAVLWRARKALAPALRQIAPKRINEDVVVPVSRLPELIDRLNILSQEMAIPIVNFGHAGNGNTHVNLLVDRDNPEKKPEPTVAWMPCSPW